VKLIPFDRHFRPDEQDTGLKKLFQKGENRSAILNWLIEGYRMLRVEGLVMPERVAAAIASYRLESDVFGTFLAEYTIDKAGSRLPTSELYSCYTAWAKDNGFRQMNSKDFVGELRRRCDVRRDGSTGNVVVGFALSASLKPQNETTEKCNHSLHSYH
jgi:putative DNA primase/helicase